MTNRRDMSWERQEGHQPEALLGSQVGYSAHVPCERRCGQSELLGGLLKTDFWAPSLESLTDEVCNLTDSPGDGDTASLTQGSWEPLP